MRTLLSFVFGLSLGGVIAVLAAFNALLLWVATGPRTLDGLTPYIEAAFTPENGRFSVHIDKTLLLWDGWRNPVDIRLRNVIITTQNGEKFSQFPEIAVGLDFLSLFMGKVQPSSLVVHRPIISLYQDENYGISFGPQEEAPGQFAAPDEGDTLLPLASVLGPLLGSDEAANSPIARLDRLRITGADISIGSVAKGIFFEAHDAELSINKDDDGPIELIASARMRYDEFQSSGSARFLVSRESKLADGLVEFRGIEPRALARLFSANQSLEPLNLPLSGSANVAISAEKGFERVQFTLDGGRGELQHAYWNEPLPIGWVRAEGKLTDNFKNLSLTSLRAEVAGLPLEASGEIARQELGLSVQMKASTKDVDTAKVPALWPEKLAPLTREWVVENIKDGCLPLASVALNLAPGDLEKPVLPKASIQAEVGLDNVTLRYLPEHPPATAVSGRVLIDAIALHGEIDSAKYMDDTQIRRASVAIDDLNLDNPYINVALEAESSARDVARFLGLPRLKHSERLGINAKEISGKVTGSAKVGFFFFAPLGPNGKPVEDPPIDFDVKASLADVSQNGFMKKFDLKAVSGEVTVNPQQLEFNGAGTVNDAAVQRANVRYLFTPKEGLDTFIEVKANAPAASLPRFGYQGLDFISGSLGVDATVEMGAALENAKASLNLNAAGVNVAAIGWNKPAGEPLSLELATQKKEGALTIPSFVLKGKAVEMKGSAALDAAMSGFSKLNAAPMMLGNTRLSRLNYEKNGNAMRVDVLGDVLDISGYMEPDPTKPKGKDDGFSFARFPALSLNANIGRVITGKERSLRDFQAELSCSAEQCDSAKISGKTAEKPFSMRIFRNPKGVRQLAIRAEDAGAFLKSLQLFDGMEGGDLTITGNYSGNKELRGRIDISEHVIKDAPVLAKILSLASFTGFFDTLQGKGITFAKLFGRFRLQNDVITLEKMRTHGAAIGMTAEGSITMPQVVFDLKGTIAPSYTLNSALGKVPVVGEMLAGGKGEGIFAANYSVKGPEQNPDVSVNPLSILTPGFLRNVFDFGSSETEE